jgi:hypothetical protein
MSCSSSGRTRLDWEGLGVGRGLIGLGEGNVGRDEADGGGGRREARANGLGRDRTGGNDDKD